MSYSSYMYAGRQAFPIIMAKFRAPAGSGISDSVMFNCLFFLGKYKGPAFFATLIGPHIFKIYCDIVSDKGMYYTHRLRPY